MSPGCAPDWRTRSAYARGIRVDMSQMEDLVGRFDPRSRQHGREMMGNAEMFEIPQTPEQQAPRAAETLLALVEGWVDHAVSAAVARPTGCRACRSSPRRCVGAVPQVVRRRRRSPTSSASNCGPSAEGGVAVLGAREADGDLDSRDGYWGHPDLMPTAEDLDDLDGFFQRSGAVDLELPTGPAETIEDTEGNVTPNPEGQPPDEDRAAGRGPRPGMGYPRFRYAAARLLTRQRERGWQPGDQGWGYCFDASVAVAGATGDRHGRGRRRALPAGRPVHEG